MHSILFYVDQEDARVRHAEEIAGRLGATLTLVTVVPPVPSRLRRGSEEIQRLIVDDHREKLERMRLDSERAHATRVLVGRPDEEIIKEVAAGSYNLLLKSPAPDGQLLGRLAGTIDMRLLRACPCPVGVIRPDSEGEFRRVVAAVNTDDSVEFNQTILDYAALVAAKGFRELHLLHAWTLFGESMMRSGRGRLPPEELRANLAQEEQRRRESLDELMGLLEERLGAADPEYPRPTLHLIKGDPGPVVPELVEQLGADLLIMGTKPRIGLPGLLIGNTAERLLGQVNCSVLTVKSAGP